MNKELFEGILDSGYEYTMSHEDRNYIKDLKGYGDHCRISTKFLETIGVSSELVEKAQAFEAKYGKMPEMNYGSRLGTDEKNTKIRSLRQGGDERLGVRR